MNLDKLHTFILYITELDISDSLEHLFPIFKLKKLIVLKLYFNNNNFGDLSIKRLLEGIS